MPQRVSDAILNFGTVHRVDANARLPRTWEGAISGLKTKELQVALTEHANMRMHKEDTTHELQNRHAYALLAGTHNEIAGLAESPGIGAWLTCRAKTQLNSFKILDFQIHVMWRGYYPVLAPDPYCSHQLTYNLCEQLLCDMGHHTFNCATRARSAKHNSMRAVCCNTVRRVGTVAKTEQIVADVRTRTGRNAQGKVLVADARIQEHLGHSPK